MVCSLFFLNPKKYPEQMFAFFILFGYNVNGHFEKGMGHFINLLFTDLV